MLKYLRLTLAAVVASVLASCAETPKPLLVSSVHAQRVQVRLKLPEGSSKQADVLGHGADAAPRVVEILTEIGVM